MIRSEPFIVHSFFSICPVWQHEQFWFWHAAFEQFRMKDKNLSMQWIWIHEMFQKTLPYQVDKNLKLADHSVDSALMLFFHNL